MNAIIFGAGTYGEVYLSYLEEAGYNIMGFLDDNKKLWDSKICGIKVLGGLNELQNLKNKGIQAVFCPLGNNKLRVEVLTLAKEYGLETPNYIHPSVNLSPNVQVSNEGVYILPNVTIMPKVQIDRYVMISVGANIVHHTKLFQGVFVSNGANIGASICVKEYAYIGMGATVMTGVKTV